MFETEERKKKKKQKLLSILHCKFIKIFLHKYWFLRCGFLFSPSLKFSKFRLINFNDTITENIKFFESLTIGWSLTLSPVKSMKTYKKSS